MVGLLDIAPAGETVSVRGQQVSVYGVSARGLAILLTRFPELRALIAQQQQEVTGARLMELVPDAIAAIIAAGTGMPGNADAEAVADALSLEEQIDLLDPIIRLTLPQGIAHFIGRLAGLAGRLGVESLAPVTPDSN